MFGLDGNDGARISRSIDGRAREIPTEGKPGREQPPMVAPQPRPSEAPPANVEDGDILGSLLSDSGPDAGVDTPAPMPAAKPAAVAPAKEVPGDSGLPQIPEDVAPRAAEKKEVPASPETMTDADLLKGAPRGVVGNPQAEYTWKTLKKKAAEAERLEQELATLKESGAGAKPDATTEAQLAALAKEVEAYKVKTAEYEDKLGRVDVTQSASFREKFDTPIQREMQRGVRLLMEVGGKDKDASTKLIQQLVNPKLPYSEVQEMVSDEPTMLQGALLNVVSSAREAIEARDAGIRDWRTVRQAQAAEETKNTVVKLTEQIVPLTNAAVQEVVKGGNYLFAESQVDQKWNDGVRERKNLVHGILRGSNPKEIARWVADGVTADTYRKMFESEKSRREKIEAEMQEMFDMTPGVGSRGLGGGTVRPSPKGPVDIGQTIGAILEE